MNAFNQKLSAARSAQRKRLFVAFGLLLGGACLAAGLFAYLNGTALSIHPEDADQIGQVQITDGLAVSVSDVVYSLSRETQIRVSAQGFKSENRTLTGGDKGRTVDITLSELPGRLIAATVPEDASTRWKLNGRRAAVGATLHSELAPGTYTLDAESRYFEPLQRTFEMARDGNVNLSLAMQPVHGQLKINSQPQGAQVHVDGRDVGATPATVAVDGGQHLVTVGMDAYQTIEDRLEVTYAERLLERNYRLLRQHSELVFDLKPKGGVLLVNGRKVDPTDRQSVRSAVENTVSYSRPGYTSKSRKLLLQPGETKTVDLHLVEELGVVTVRSQPAAEVYVNEKPYGKTPLTLNLQTVSQSISLRKPGYRSLTKSVVPSRENPTALSATLRTEEQARTADAPRAYTSKAGIELLLFLEPTDFIMGAPRGEKGQRANEFQRSVRFTKPFYGAKHETTNGQYQKFKSSHSGTGGDQVPVTSVRWFDAVQFCNWLSEQENLEAFYILAGGRVSAINKNANGYRLLTEAEWEWLARRAARPTQTVFPWGNSSTVPARAGNIADESAKGLVPFYIPKYTDGFAERAPVGQFNKEPSGLYDLAGNVSEWVHDVYSLQAPARNQVAVDPLRPLIGSSHVVKGSNWRSGTRSTLRAAYREGLVDRRDDVGFRIGRYL